MMILNNSSRQVNNRALLIHSMVQNEREPQAPQSYILAPGSETIFPTRDGWNVSASLRRAVI